MIFSIFSILDILFVFLLSKQNISLFFISPILNLFPIPLPICIEIAPFPLVFHGMLGFNLTNFG